jgi:SET domain-containing protein
MNAVHAKHTPTDVHPLLRLGKSTIQGAGLFARQTIPAGIAVIEYVGEKITKRQSLVRCQQNCPFIFYLNTRYDLDGSVDWNLARLINHSCALNCSAELRRGHIWIVTERVIAAGEEISFDYGYDLEDHKNYPCSCGASQCRGYIVAADLWAERPASLG